MSREDTTDAAEEDASEQSQAGRRAGIDAFQEPAGHNQDEDYDKRAKHPQQELPLSEKRQQLVQIV